MANLKQLIEERGEKEKKLDALVDAAKGKS
jgi:hypothetical protein